MTWLYYTQGVKIKISRLPKSGRFIRVNQQSDKYQKPYFTNLVLCASSEEII